MFRSRADMISLVGLLLFASEAGAATIPFSTDLIQRFTFVSEENGVETRTTVLGPSVSLTGEIDTEALLVRNIQVVSPRFSHDFSVQRHVGLASVTIDPPGFTPPETHFIDLSYEYFISANGLVPLTVPDIAIDPFTLRTAAFPIVGDGSTNGILTTLDGDQVIFQKAGLANGIFLATLQFGQVPGPHFSAISVTAALAPGTDSLILSGITRLSPSDLEDVFGAGHVVGASGFPGAEFELWTELFVPVPEPSGLVVTSLLGLFLLRSCRMTGSRR